MGKKLFLLLFTKQTEQQERSCLKKKQNPVLWKLIYEFYKKTGVPALLNTSFNLHGFPIVKSVNDALNVFKKSELEVLWLDNHIIEK